MADILATQRLLLREIMPADIVVLQAIFGDETCMRYYPAVKTLEETTAWFQKLAFDSYALHGFGLWAVIDRQSGALIGDCGITLQRTSSGLEPEIGYHFLHDVWGRGFATEAASACRDYAFHALGFSRVVSIVAADNIGSQRVAAKVHDRCETSARTDPTTGRVVERSLYISERLRPTTANAAGDAARGTVSSAVTSRDSS